MSSQLQDALGMFAFLAIELSVLFIGISLLVGVLQRHIPPSSHPPEHHRTNDIRFSKSLSFET